MRNLTTRLSREDLAPCQSAASPWSSGSVRGFHRQRIGCQGPGCLRHLVVSHHDARRFAYVRGPEKNDEAELRHRAFVETLNEHGLEIDPHLILPGDFRIEGGRQAIHTLFRGAWSFGGSADVIVAVNDGLAPGGIDGLLARGVRVPWQPAVLGSTMASWLSSRRCRSRRSINPSIGQGTGYPLARQSHARGTAENVLLSTGLVVRHSCGCLDGMGSLQLSAEDFRRRWGRGFELALLERRERILRETRRVTRTGSPGCRAGGSRSSWMRCSTN